MAVAAVLRSEEEEAPRGKSKTLGCFSFSSAISECFFRFTGKALWFDMLFPILTWYLDVLLVARKSYNICKPHCSCIDPEYPGTETLLFRPFLAIMQRASRLKRELQMLSTEPPPGISCWQAEERIDELRARQYPHKPK